MKLKFGVTNQECSEASYIVCTRAGDPTPFRDNVRSLCHLCGQAVQHRPHVPANVPRICLACYHATHTADETHLVSKQSMVELLLLQRRN